MARKGPADAPPGESLARYIDESCFAVPDYVDVESAWIEHAPFASWLVANTRPASIVELGTHGGYSYFVFCRAVTSGGLPTRCYAVDHWMGDDHAGLYGNEVYERVRAHNDEHYSSFSRLIRATFDDARREVEDGTVDLLHIDGRHGYEDVKVDFETWLPKLSERGVVLFHDTKVVERGFGVYRLMAELREAYPMFEFDHGHGLGVVAVGSSAPQVVLDLCAAESVPALAGQIRSAYSRLGLALSAPLQLQQAADAARALEASFDEEKRAIQASTSWRITAPLRLVSRLVRRTARTTTA